MGIRIGICGAGSFGRRFLSLFQAHPQVDEVYLADVSSQRLGEVAKEHAIRKTFGSLDELLQSDVDAVAIFTQRWLHGPQAVKALKAGKHVYSAVPAAVTLEELQALVDAVKETGLVYMLGETSYYRPQTVYCRTRFARGDFGRFVYGEGQYHHDMSHFYRSYMHSGGDAWKETASFPPMLYPTHSVSHVLSVTFRRMTEVSCFGYVDEHPDGIFDADLSRWANVFSNQSALFRTSDGGTARINEFRRIGAGESRMTVMGTRAAYEEQPSAAALPHATWSALEQDGDLVQDGTFDYGNAAKKMKKVTEDVAEIHRGAHLVRAHPDYMHTGVEITEENLGDLPPECLGKVWVGVSKVHPVHRLPKEFVGRENGHNGSHQFLVVDFVEAVTTGQLPPNNVWMAARYNAPGIVAHESAKRDGERLRIPDFGRPPKDARLMDPLAEMRD